MQLGGKRRGHEEIERSGVGVDVGVGVDEVVLRERVPDTAFRSPCSLLTDRTTPELLPRAPREAVTCAWVYSVNNMSHHHKESFSQTILSYLCKYTYIDRAICGQIMIHFIRTR